MPFLSFFMEIAEFKHLIINEIIAILVNFKEFFYIRSRHNKITLNLLDSIFILQIINNKLS